MKKLPSWLKEIWIISLGACIIWGLFQFWLANYQKSLQITCTSPLSIYTAENGAQSCLTDKEYSDIISSRFSRVGDDERGVDCYILDQGKANQTMSCLYNSKHHEEELPT